MSLSGSGIKRLVAMFRDEMVATPETWTTWDTFGLMQTIGAIPQP